MQVYEIRSVETNSVVSYVGAPDENAVERAIRPGATATVVDAALSDAPLVLAY